VIVRGGFLVAAVCTAAAVIAWCLLRLDPNVDTAERKAQPQKLVVPAELPPREAPVTTQLQHTASVQGTLVEAAAIMAVPPPPIRQRWLENAVVAKPPNGRPMIAVVVDDMGLDRRRSARALELPGPLTLAFMSYAQDLPAQTSEARRRGHELMVHVPMEPTGRSANPGPNALFTSLSTDEVLRRLETNLAAFDGYVGINNHMGSRFTSDPPAITPVLQELKSRGLLFIDSRTGPSVAADIAKSLELPHASRDVFIDHDVSASAVAESLRKLEAIARRSGHAIGIGHPKDETLNQLARWLPGLEAKGFILVPVSAIVRATLPEGQMLKVTQFPR
jgi:polysaccharide deacetylase 2 family uncharacterized protein YibQ